jgi:hypothetical protein
MNSTTNSSSNTIGILPGAILQKMTTLNSGVITGGTNYGNIVDDVNIAQAKAMLVDIPLVVQGRDVMKELDELRDSVLLLKRHVDMEAKYPKLKELKDAYESQLAKYKTFDAIKESK